MEFEARVRQRLLLAVTLAAGMGAATLRVLAAEVQALTPIPLRVDPGAALPDTVWALGCGLPLHPGQLVDPGSLAVIDAAGHAVPAAFEARTRWTDGSVQWLWIDFVAPVRGPYRVVAGTGQVVPPSTSSGSVAVRDADGMITVSTDAGDLVWDRRFAAPVAFRALGPGESIAFDGARGDGVYLIDQRGRRAVMGGTGAELDWRIETANAVRAVLRVEGYYVGADGERLARAVLRYHLAAGLPWFRIEHRFIVTRDNEEIAYKEIGLTLPLAVADRAVATLGKRQGEAYSTALAPAETACICQQKFPLYNRRDQYACPIVRAGKEVEDCREAGGWAALDNGATCLVVAMRDFAEQFPKELAVAADAVTLKLWSGRDGKILDYKPATMAQDWWQDWLDRLEHSSIPADWFKARGITVENVRNGTFNPSCVGVSRTHDFYVAYLPSAGGLAHPRSWAATAQLPPVAYADPRWITRADPRVLPPLACKGEGGAAYAALERYISGWFDKFLLPLELFPMTGWYDWGKASEQRYERLADGTVYSQFYRLELFNNYAFARHLFYAWLRSGDRKYLTWAERMLRLMSDYRVIQWSGGRDGKTRGYCCYGGGHFPVYWKGAGSLSFFRTDDYFGAAGLGYYLRDTRFPRDDLALRAEVLSREYRPEPRFVSAPTRHMVIMAELHRLTGNPVFRDLAATLFNLHTDLEQPYAINPAWYASKTAAYDGPRNKLVRKIMWTTMYADWSGEKRARAAAIKGFLDGGVNGSGENPKGCYYHPGPDSYKNFMGYVAARVYDWTGDPAMLGHIRWQLDWLSRSWQAFESLSADERGLPGTLRRVIAKPAARAGSPRPYVFAQLRIPEKTSGGSAATLYFGNWNNGVPFLAVPAGIRALVNAPPVTVHPADDGH